MQNPVVQKRPPPLFSHKAIELGKDTLNDLVIEFELVPEEVQLMQFIKEKTSYLRDLTAQQQP